MKLLYCIYLKQSIGILFVLMTVIAIFNIAIDPYRVFGVTEIEGFNKIKVKFGKHGRLGKAYVVNRLKPDGLIIGTSRAENGISPKHGSWKADNVYNLALQGSSIYEQYRYLQHAISAGKIKQLVIALDFMSFNSFRLPRDDFKEERLNVNAQGYENHSSLQDYMQDSFTLDAISASIETIATQDAVSFIDESGALNTLHDKFANESYNSFILDILSTESALIVGGNGMRPLPYNTFDLYSGPVKVFDFYQALLKLAHENGIQTFIFIPPLHVRLQYALYEMKLWDEYEEWKRKLVSINERTALELKVKSYLLWDFSELNSYTTEPLPKRKDSVYRMKWYWETSHYRHELGDKILSVILTDGQFKDNAAESFTGVILTSDSIDEDLNKIRNQMDSYIVNNGNQLEDVKEMVFGASYNAVFKKFYLK